MSDPLSPVVKPVSMIRRLSETNNQHPLLSSSTDSTKTYAVYSSKRDQSNLITSAPSTSSAALNQPPPLPLAISSTAPSSPPKLPTFLSRSSGIIPSIETNSNAIPPPPRRTMSEASVNLIGQNLKAQLQNLGLNNESVGFLMVNKLSNLGREIEWKGILVAVGCGKVTLLLPKEKLLDNVVLSPTFFLDHLILVDAPIASTSSSPSSSIRGFTSLSGFRGTIDEDNLVFASCGSLLSETANGKPKPGSLHPPNLADVNLHSAMSGSATPSIFDESFSIATMSSITDLSIPRMLSIAADRRKEALGRQATSTGSRLAALFTKTPPPTPETASDSSTLSDNSPSDPNSLSKSSFFELSVLAVERTVRHSEVIKSITSSLDSHLRNHLESVKGCDLEVIDRITALVARFQPPETWLNSFPPAGARTLPVDSLFGKSIEDIADSIQDLLQDSRDDITKNLRAIWNAEEPANQNYGALEELVDKSLEQVEDLVLSSIYDRIFCTPSSADSQEDENLASRIAALNLLDLSLDHLGIDLDGGVAYGWDESRRSMKDSIEDIVSLAGKELSKLQDPSVRSPRAKITIFVNLHKIIVDNLSRLPPIPLKDSKPDVEALVGRKLDLDNASIKTTSRPPSNHQVLETSTSSRSASPNQELASSVHEATTSSLFDREAPSITPPVDIIPTSLVDDTNKSSTSSADLILPILIYLVVKHNQPRLYSNLLYVQRFRSDSLMRGESAYCSTNIHATVDFLNHVDMVSLGLSSQNIITYSSNSTPSTSPTKPGSPVKSRLAGVGSRVTKETLSQELDQLVDKGNEVLANSMRLFFGGAGLPKTIEDVKMVLDGAGSVVASKAKGSLLRRGGTESGNEGGVQREMMDIAPSSQVVSEDGIDPEEEARMLESKPSLTDRLARLASGTSTPTKSTLFSFGSRPASFVAPPTSISTGVKPIAKFMECEVGDLTMNEVAELLADYKRLGSLMVEKTED